MLTNKIYQNYFTKEIKNIFSYIFGLSIIAWTVRAVNFLDLIVESGYSILTYFQYSFLNLFAILTKFNTFLFFISFIYDLSCKTKQDNEFIILWTSGVKKLKIS